MKSVSRRSMIRCLRTTRSARARPVFVRSASFRWPRSIRPSLSSRLSISPADAGGTVFLGLPMGRVQYLGRRARAGLSAFATGILVFLLWDVISGAVEPIESGLDDRDWGQFFGYAALGLAGFALGYMTLIYYTEWMKKRGQARASNLVGPGAAATDEFRGRTRIEHLTPASQLALLIAVGIGVHNFGEGLAIGQAAANDLTALAVTL